MCAESYTVFSYNKIKYGRDLSRTCEVSNCYIFPSYHFYINNAFLGFE